mgnify:CR=1 FL=1
MKGGYEVRIARQRAFCPFSQIDIVRNTEPAQHEGRAYRFLIIEFKEGGRNLVVSRRALLEEEQQASAAEVRKSIVAGAVADRARRLGARVRRVRRTRRRRSGPAARVRDGVGARVGSVAGRQARRRDHRQGPARRTTTRRRSRSACKQLLDDPWSKALAKPTSPDSCARAA